MLWINNSTTQKPLSAIIKDLSPQEKILRDEILIDIDVFFDSLNGKNYKDDLAVYHALVAHVKKIYSDSTEIRAHFNHTIFKYICFNQSAEAAALLTKPAVKMYLRERAASKKAGTTTLNNLTQSVSNKTADIVPHKSTLPTQEYLAERRKSLWARSSEINKKYAHISGRAMPQSMLTQNRVAVITEQSSPQISKPQSTPNSHQTPTFTSAEIDKIMQSGDTAKINALMKVLTVEEIHVVKSKDPDAISETEFQISTESRVQEKKHPMIEKGITTEKLITEVERLRKSYGNLQYVKVKEIRLLQNWDIVDFSDLKTGPGGKIISHFRIVKIDDVSMNHTKHTYDIVCFANCAYTLNGSGHILIEKKLTIHMPLAGLKSGMGSLSVFSEGNELFTAQISGPMLVFTKDQSAYDEPKKIPGASVSSGKQRFVRFH